MLALAVSIPASAFAVDYTFTCNDALKIGPINTQFKLKCYLSHSEASPVEFYVAKTEEFPPGNDWEWSASICVNSACLAPDVDEYTFTVNPGAVDTVEAYINGYFLEGSSEVVFTLYPTADPGNVSVQNLAALTNGVDVLVVDDDGDLAYQDYYTDALPTGLTWGRWPRFLEAPTTANMNVIGRVVWFTGEESPTLDATDRANLTSFLNGGGDLVISGQNIAYDLCDPASSNYSVAACTFLADYLGATYDVDNSGSTNVTGDSPDMIGEGLAFSISGGAANQSSPDGVGATGSGRVAFTYDATSYAAGTHLAAGSRRTIYLAFGLEGISSLATRQAILDRSFDFFDAAVGVEAGGDALPALPVLGPNRPNPFNPTTSFTLVVPEPTRARVDIFDASGRVVTTLLDGSVAAGETPLVWNGTNGAGAPVRSGVYFARMTAGDRVETRKLTLVR